MTREGFQLALVALLGVTCVVAAAPSDRQLTFEERVEAQREIDRLTLERRLGDTRDPAAVLTRDHLERRVLTYLRQTAALEQIWNVSLAREDLAVERERIFADTRMPGRLDEVLRALDGDLLLFDECFVRPLLVDGLVRRHFAADRSIHAGARVAAEGIRERLEAGTLRPDEEHPHRSVIEFLPAAGISPGELATLRDGTHRVLFEPDALERERRAAQESLGRPDQVEVDDAFGVRLVLSADAERVRRVEYAVPKVPWDDWWRSAATDLEPAWVGGLPAGSSVGGTEPGTSPATRGACAGETWSVFTGANAPSPRREMATVWTGNVMIVWGGRTSLSGYLGSGSLYDPMTDSWSPMSTTGAPPARSFHSGVWTGSEMIVWGGYSGISEATGGRYDPLSDTWTATDLATAPEARDSHSAVWTGSEMIVWGGYLSFLSATNTGSRYDPATDTWTETNFVDAASARAFQTAVWTGSEMIVWGGLGGGYQNTGGRYDPTTDTWTGTSTVGAAVERDGHASVWTGTEMIVWGGYNGDYLDSGGRYDPAADAWSSTATLDAPAPRAVRPAVWTGSEMIVWGGFDSTYLDTGARYRPASDSWLPTATSGVPTERNDFGMVWSGTEMIVWGGLHGLLLGDGGGYALSVDNDLDGFCTEIDCNDENDLAWEAPGEAESLVFTAGDTMSWAVPSSPGAAVLAYDVIRSSVPDDFVTAAVCVESDDSLDTVATDAATPVAAEVFHYLVRAQNDCPDGEGDLGTDSSGAPRTARVCP